MIPRAVQKVFEVTENLRPKGWEYMMEGQFLEIVSELMTHEYVTDSAVVQRDLE
jgi:hypothetical protein